MQKQGRCTCTHLFDPAVEAFKADACILLIHHVAPFSCKHCRTSYVMLSAAHLLMAHLWGL
jgi:hypothetical protein